MRSAHLTSPLVSARLLGQVLARVRAAGGDAAADALIRTFDLPRSVERDAEVWLSLATLRGFYDRAAEAVGDPFFGLHLVDRMPHGRFGLLEYCCRSAPTVREALRRAAHYSGLLNPIVKLTFTERKRDRSAVIEGMIRGEPLCLGRHANENALALLVRQTRGLSGTGAAPRRAWLAHPAPPDVTEHARVLGTTELAFGREANGLEWPAEVLDLPLATADAPLLSLLDEQAMRALRDRSQAEGFLGAVKQAVRDCLVAGAPSLADAARTLKTTSRTLQRRLEREGSSFSDVVDAVRHELALVYVADERRPLGEVAYLLGYSELRAFLRAFRRWTGRTPSQLRG